MVRLEWDLMILLVLFQIRASIVFVMLSWRITDNHKSKYLNWDSREKSWKRRWKSFIILRNNWKLKRISIALSRNRTIFPRVYMLWPISTPHTLFFFGSAIPHIRLDLRMRLNYLWRLNFILLSARTKNATL